MCRCMMGLKAKSVAAAPTIAVVFWAHDVCVCARALAAFAWTGTCAAVLRVISQVGDALKAAEPCATAAGDCSCVLI